MKLKKSVKKFLVMGIVSVGVLFGSVMAIASTFVSKDDIKMKEVTVHKGDTIWNLVKQENKHYNGDLRNLTDFVKEDVNIHPGQVIKIPVYNK